MCVEWGKAVLFSLLSLWGWGGVCMCGVGRQYTIHPYPHTHSTVKTILPSHTTHTYTIHPPTPHTHIQQSKHYRDEFPSGTPVSPHKGNSSSNMGINENDSYNLVRNGCKLYR